MTTMTRSRRSLQFSIMLHVIPAVALFLLASIGYTVIRDARQLESALGARAELVAALQAAGLSEALWDFDLDIVANVVQGLSRDPDFAAAWVIDENGNRVAEHIIREPEKRTVVTMPAGDRHGGVMWR